MSDDLLARIDQARKVAVVVDAEVRLSNRERFPMVTEMVDELRAQGFKGTKLVFARNEAGETYGTTLPETGWVSADVIIAMDDHTRRCRSNPPPKQPRK
jgi:hypothetical protein